MAGYHDILISDVYSQGSEFSVSYDTRITTLESGIEVRMSKYRPEGRRRYTVLKGIASQQDILGLYEFFILRQGALNSFRFRDWMDYATNPTRETFSPEGIASPVTAFDHPLTLITGRTYKMVTIYQDAARTIIRPIDKVQLNTELIASDGTPLLVSEYTINYESGEVTIDASVGQLGTITGGCQFFVVVRFAETTDEAFTIAMQATDDTQSLPGFSLVEDVAPDGVSQDYQYGGSHIVTGLTTTVRLLEVQGRLQSFTVTNQSAALVLPLSFNIPAGGPIFVLHNSATSSNSLNILDSSFSVIAVLPIGGTIEVFLVADVGGDFWVLTQP